MGGKLYAITSVGPVSSLHDRACELYYALRGGIVDYGAQHAEENGHARYGRTHEQGLYPEWSREKPLHFLGHSMGGPTIIKLQWLISIDFFSDTDHSDMLLSITTISAPFRGSQAVYALGERTDKPPSVRPFSVGAMIAKFVHVASYFSPFLPAVLDFHADARSLSCYTSDFWTLVKHLWHSDWAEGRDASPFDVTFQASDHREAHLEGLVNPKTFYRSYATCMTERSSVNWGFHIPRIKSVIYVPGLYALSRAMGMFDFSVVNPTPDCVKKSKLDSEYFENSSGSEVDTKGKTQEALWANDGVVPLFSQWHPLSCSTTHCRHYARALGDTSHKQDLAAVQSGLWHVYHIDDANHISLAPIWFGTSRQKALWREVGQWLRNIDVSSGFQQRP
ncbi:hypothetical protein NM688_g3790 [Phlebia brevispora]|uniref:Uncharacterized protein n=1 Tax=Phlebia brevispora TaxID=194682 RepID=A0ACC1T4Z5_9APHY|nr:hypothetical protein NM688_g3790 [Phlebia brevispora]